MVRGRGRKMLVYCIIVLRYCFELRVTAGRTARAFFEDKIIS